MKDRIIFLSHVIDVDTPSYGNRDKFIVEQISEVKQGKSANSSKWTFTSNHLGTHVDVPKHFFDNGKTITDYYPQEWIFKKIQIIDVPCEKADLIGIAEIEHKIESDIDLLLIRTGYEKYRSKDKYWNDNPGLTPELGFWLRENFRIIRAVGFDFISLSSWKFRDVGKEAHKAFLDPQGVSDQILIIEDMKLGCIEKASKVIVAPILVEYSNGAPVTIIAEIDEGEL